MLVQLSCPPMPYLVVGGRSRFRPGDLHEKRVLGQTFDLLLVDEGTLDMEVDGEQHHLGHGQYLLIPPGTPHRGWRHCTSETTFAWAHFHAPGGWALTETAGPPRSRRLNKGKYYTKDPFSIILPTTGTLDGAPLVHLYDALVSAEHVRIDNFAHAKAFHTLDRPEVVYQAAFLSALAILADEITAVPAQQDLAEDVHAYLGQHLDQKVTAAHLAQRFAFSEGHVIRSVKTRYGYGPRQLHIRMRLEAAARLLDSTDLAVAAIARRVGFDTPSYFAKRFKEYHGCEPSRFRGRSAEEHPGGKAAGGQASEPGG
ncbi:AraC family transcriptional regulator [Georgenia sp. TF02-10]|uniref:helix-turn-helix domain-containing protein n=1 Tax=Georgenia sp. TF02-10 TaxID=2917725 RepID=UPI001FA7CF27|nr:AraC family transcriptional regulator [Georgenia sp. TF02-10]UNX55514.1 AraC family transcriptional regulator [Georgenia sp. TF02-10]